MLHDKTIEELDDLYYEAHSQGATLLELKQIREVQEKKLMQAPPEERKFLARQIRQRCYKTLFSNDLKQKLPGLRNYL